MALAFVVNLFYDYRSLNGVFKSKWSACDEGCILTLLEEA
jgi:hypothetical protein